MDRNMGYVDGKTDLDLILADDKSAEEEELLLTSQVWLKDVLLFTMEVISQSCLDAMKDLRRRQQMMIVESREMAEAIQEFILGLRQQVPVHLTDKRSIYHVWFFVGWLYFVITTT